MLKFLKQKNKKIRGFSLVEVLVALFIFTLSVTAVMAVLSSGVSNISNSKKKMTAEYLAQEGIEMVRNIRDTFSLESPANWNGFKNPTFNSCRDGSPDNLCSVDFDSENKPKITPCGNSPCPSVVSFPGMVRSIRISIIGDNEIKVFSKVTWDNGAKSVTFSENLYNWIEH